MVKLGDRHILSVDWDARELRVVHARVRKETVVVQDVFAVSIPSDTNLSDPEALGRVLHGALVQEGISCRHVLMDIPRDQAVLNTLSLPNVSISDMAGMVQLQIAKALPFPVSEAVIDFAIPPDDGEAETRDVLVGAVRGEVVDYYRQVCQTAGLRLDRVGLRPYANRVAVTNFLSGQTPERVLIVDVGPGLTEIDVLRRGQLVFSRAASVYVPSDNTAVLQLKRDRSSSAEETSAADGGDSDIAVVPFGRGGESRPRGTTAVVADLMVEVTRSIEAYRGTDPGAQMDCAVVAGGTGIEETLADAIQRRFGINAETYNPASCLDGDGQRAAAASGFSAALGLVLGHAGEGRLHFDFLHPKKQEMPGQARLKRVPIAAAVAALFVIAGAVFYTQGPAKRFAEVRRLEAEIADVKAEIKDNKKFIDMVKQVREFEDEQVIWLDELRNLIDVLPDNQQVVVNKVDMYQDDRRIALDIRAKDGGQLHRVLQNFEDYRPEEGDGPYYQASRGTTNVGKGKYAHESGLSIRIVGDAEPEKKKRG